MQRPRSRRGPVQAPRFVRKIQTGETGWSSSPSPADLNGDGKLEIVPTTIDHGIRI